MLTFTARVVAQDIEVTEPRTVRRLVILPTTDIPDYDEALFTAVQKVNRPSEFTVGDELIVTIQRKAQ